MKAANRKKVLQGRKRRANILRLFKRVIVQKGMPVIIGIHLSVPFIKKGSCKFGNQCAFMHTEETGGKPKKRYNSVVVAKTWTPPKQRTKITSQKFFAKGDLLHGVPAIPVNQFYRTLGRGLSRSSHRLASYVKEREKIGATLGIIQQSGQSGPSPKALSYEQLGCCADVSEATMAFAGKKA